MPRRLLREPPLLAHELRTPLSVLAGWYSLIRDGDITPQSATWSCAMEACQQAIDRLNLVISEACDEADAVRRLMPDQTTRMIELMDATKRAIDESERVLQSLHNRRPAGARRPLPDHGSVYAEPEAQGYSQR